MSGLTEFTRRAIVGIKKAQFCSSSQFFTRSHEFSNFCKRRYG